VKRRLVKGELTLTLHEPTRKVKERVKSKAFRYKRGKYCCDGWVCTKEDPSLKLVKVCCSVLCQRKIMFIKAGIMEVFSRITIIVFLSGILVFLDGE